MREGISTQVKETQRVPDRINPRQKTPRHILIKLTKYQTQRANIKSRKGKATNNTQRDSNKDNS